MNIKPYIKALRLNYWFKNLVTIFGYFGVFVFSDTKPLNFLSNLNNFILATILACLISSANYILNEITDKNGDIHHPIKKDRPLVNNQVSQSSLIKIMGFIILTTFIIAMYKFNTQLIISLFLLFIAGLVYNLSPLRLKDVAYLDVISESINNPIRILIGWFSVNTTYSSPPISFLLMFWFFGALLMSTKRYKELNFLIKKKGIDSAKLYRKSYSIYSPINLKKMVIIYSVIAVILLTYQSTVYPESFYLMLTSSAATYIWFVAILNGYQT